MFLSVEITLNNTRIEMVDSNAFISYVVKSLLCLTIAASSGMQQTTIKDYLSVDKISFMLTDLSFDPFSSFHFYRHL
jgi:hypothetical protein